MLGELFLGLVGESASRASFFAYTGTVATYHRRRGALRAGNGGGFALHEAFWGRVIGVSEPHVVQFPPSGGGEAVMRGGVVAKVQTHWVKNVENMLI